MTDVQSTELVAQLRLVRPNAKYEYRKDEFLMIGAVMREAADAIERLQLLAADYGGQLVAERAETKRLRTAIGHYVRTKLAGAGENAHYWWTLQEIAKERQDDVGGSSGS